MQGSRRSVTSAEHLFFFLRRTRYWSVLAGVLALLTASARANDEATRVALDQRYVTGQFRIYYTREGAHAFTGQVPGAMSSEALVRQLGWQLQRGERFYREVIGLDSPLTSSRFNSVGAVDVHVLDMGEKLNGTASRVVRNYRYTHFHDPLPTLTITLARHWKPGNLTPEHEVFHLYQYGYTDFGNPWFFEGLALSLGGAFDPRGYQTAPLPRTIDEFRQLEARGSAASSFWSSVLLKCEPKCSVTWQGDRYTPTMGICGRGFIRAFFEELSKAGEKLAQHRGINAAHWPTRERRSAENHRWLYRGMARAIEQHCPIAEDTELDIFHSLLMQQSQPDA